MTETQPVVLIIEDEEAIRKFLRVSLTGEGYSVVESATAEDGLVQAASCQPDVIILDLGLPDMDGVELTRQIRQWSKVPIIIVSARGKEQDKVVALDAGADDYLTKPFAVGELLARVRVALRHLAAVKPGLPDPVFELGSLRVDLAHRLVRVDGRDV